LNDNTCLEIKTQSISCVAALQKRTVASHGEKEACAMSPVHYRLVCVACGAEYREEEGVWRLACDKEQRGEHGPALLRSVFTRPVSAAVSSLSPSSPLRPWATIGDFADWLPCRDPLTAELPTCAPVSFRSAGLGRALGLTQLWVSFSGYWPERGAALASCTFKELEAAAIAARLDAAGCSDRVVVVASAGNTARAFA
jgi:cysteate synthase